MILNNLQKVLVVAHYPLKNMVQGILIKDIVNMYKTKILINI